MTDNPFRQPGGQGDKFDTHAYKGSLLLVFCKGYQDLVKTSKGETSEAACDIVVIDRIDPATQMPEFYDNAKLFGNLARSVGRDDGVGAYTLGWLDQVPTAGGNEAWILRDATEDANAVAQSTPWWQAHQQKKFRAAVRPATAGAPGPTAPPAHDPWAGMNATPAPPTTPAPAAAAPPGPTATSAPDPNIAVLINNGLNPQQVMAMDPATRAAVAATFQ